MNNRFIGCLFNISNSQQKGGEAIFKNFEIHNILPAVILNLFQNLYILIETIPELTLFGDNPKFRMTPTFKCVCPE